ncbi:hypothetical protein ONZ51_g7434 [Trametes cubensis]|uniref:Uncharacterized protein n=1 Tax=Trametes cubensis TaxID=1111947 RepID=A0AAD7TQH7_9APHY|nr:hypothetical protein ONZ51_g7434 [Trametes cubensis]
MGPKSASGLPSRPRVTSNTRRAAIGWSKRSAGKSTHDRKENPSTRSITPTGVQSSLIASSSPAGLHLMVHRRLSGRAVLVRMASPARVGVLSLSRPLTVLSEEMSQTLSGYDHVWVSDWLPQRTIQAHPPIDRCIIHAGHTIVQECILARGVLMILWP